MPEVDVKKLADLYRRALKSDDKNLAVMAENAVSAMIDKEAASARMTVAEAFIAETLTAMDKDSPT